VTEKELRRTIRRLRLKDSDIILCSDSDLIEQLARTKMPKGVPPCPIFWCPEGTSIRTMPKSQIADLIADLQKYL
jgi:hypothetical protein